MLEHAAEGATPSAAFGIGASRARLARTAPGRSAALRSALPRKEPKVAEEMKAQEIEDDPIEVRRAKRAAIIEEGGNPYGHAFDYTHHASDIEGTYGA